MHENFQNLRATAVIKVSGLASVAAATTSPASGLRVDWPISGCVLWIVGSSSGTSNDNYVAGMASLGFRIQVRGQTELITSGNGADYIQFASAFPSAGFRMPVGIRVKQTEAWFVYIRNTHASVAFTPDLAFGVCEGT
jgi:hypothetical protein